MRATLADLSAEEVRVFREQAKKGYAGYCVFCSRERDKLKDHVWRKHQQEMQQLYRRINEHELANAHVEDRPYDKASELLSKRKACQKESMELLLLQPKDLYKLDKASPSNLRSLTDFSWHTNDYYDWKGLRHGTSLQGTISTLAEPSYNVNSYPLETSDDRRRVLDAIIM